jgi:hypothetical protein
MDGILGTKKFRVGAHEGDQGRQFLSVQSAEFGNKGAGGASKGEEGGPVATAECGGTGGEAESGRVLEDGAEERKGGVRKRDLHDFSIP